MSIRIRCPQCGRELKVPDRSYLGQKGRCPKCTHSFVLQDSLVVDKEAEKTSPPRSSKVDEASAARTSDVTIPENELPSEAETWQDLPAHNETETAAPPPPTSRRAPRTPNAFSEAVTLNELPVFGAATESLGAVIEPISTAARLKQLQKRSPRQTITGLVVIGSICLAVAGFALSSFRSTAKPQNSTEKIEPPAAVSAPAAAEVRPEPDQADPERTEYALKGPPTSGKPIQLQYIPFGTQVVINVHPAELWRQSSPGEEVRQCVPPLANWVEQLLSQLFQRQPHEVDELLVCLIPGSREGLPEVAAVARLTDEEKRSKLIEQFGKLDDAYDQPVYVTSDRAYLIVDTKTLAVCPRGQADEMVKAIARNHPIALIDPLLPLTDRDRHLTVIFTPATFQLYESWFAESVRPLVKGMIDWLTDEVDAVAWSIHLRDDLFHSDLLLRNKSTPIKQFDQDLRRRLSGLAERLLPVIEQMEPLQPGRRTLIGRLPAMVEVFSMATIVRRGAHHVQWMTPLPDRAAPNLLLASYLAWEQSTKTDFTRSKPAATSESRLPSLLSDRLQLRINVEFRASPLSEAFSYLSGEIQVPIELDGDALKAGGFTKNLKQTFQLDAVRVQDVIKRIFDESKSVESNPEKYLVIVVDEIQQNILVTTQAAANKKGLTPFVFK